MICVMATSNLVYQGDASSRVVTLAVPGGCWQPTGVFQSYIPSNGDGLGIIGLCLPSQYSPKSTIETNTS